MKRRWIIRGFFIGLVLACLALWFCTYDRALAIGYMPVSHPQSDVIWIGCEYGSLVVAYGDWHLPGGWSINRDPELIGDMRMIPLRIALEYWSPGHRFLGFQFRHGAADPYYGRKAFGFAAVPLWFPTALSTALLWLVWRKTRPKPVGRAFPVEAKQTVEEKTP